MKPDTIDWIPLGNEGSYERNISLSSQLGEALAAVRHTALPDIAGHFDQLVVTGMGGSAIAGDFLKVLADMPGGMPVTVVRGYSLPSWVNRRTFVVACSHSGNTEETLACFQQAVSSGAGTCAITTGGQLLSLAREAQVYVLAYDFPPEPRSAFGHIFIRLMSVAQAVRAVDQNTADLDGAVQEVQDLRSAFASEAPVETNEAKRIAFALQGNVPLILGSEFLAPAARRWKTQLNENANMPAFFDELPEFHHNMIVGLERRERAKVNLGVVSLEHVAVHPRSRRRHEITAELLQSLGLPLMRINVGGTTRLAAMLRAVYFGNMVSYYLAVLNGVRPESIDNIDWVKDRLSKA